MYPAPPPMLLVWDLGFEQTQATGEPVADQAEPSLSATKASPWQMKSTFVH